MGLGVGAVGEILVGVAALRKEGLDERGMAAQAGPLEAAEDEGSIGCELVEDGGNEAGEMTTGKEERKGISSMVEVAQDKVEELVGKRKDSRMSARWSHHGRALSGWIHVGGRGRSGEKIPSNVLAIA